MSIALEQSELSNLLRLEGVIDISSAAELKELLVKALDSGHEAQGKALRVALGTATDLDVTAVQLLWAAERKARGAGVDFSFDGAIPEVIVSALTQAGFQPFLASVNAK